MPNHVTLAWCPGPAADWMGGDASEIHFISGWLVLDSTSDSNLMGNHGNRPTRYLQLHRHGSDCSLFNRMVKMTNLKLKALCMCIYILYTHTHTQYINILSTQCPITSRIRREGTHARSLYSGKTYICLKESIAMTGQSAGVF